MNWLQMWAMLRVWEEIIGLTLAVVVILAALFYYWKEGRH